MVQEIWNIPGWLLHHNMKQEKTLLPEYLSSEENTQSSSPDLKPTPAESPAQTLIPPPQIYTCTAGALHRLEMEMVQLRETVLKQSTTPELQQTQSTSPQLSALTQ